MLYLRHIFADSRLKDCLRYVVFRQTQDYDTATITAIVEAVNWNKPEGKFTTLVYVDGLTKTKRHEYGARLRHLGLAVRQVRGIAREEANALTRLADAIAGFVRDVIDGRSEEVTSLFQKARREKMLIEVSA